MNDVLVLLRGSRIPNLISLHGNLPLNYIRRIRKLMPSSAAFIKAPLLIFTDNKVRGTENAINVTRSNVKLSRAYKL